MKIPQAQQTLTELSAQTANKSEKKIYDQLIAVLNDLSARNLSGEQRQLIEEAINPLLLPHRDVRALKRSSRQFIAFVSKTFSLNSERQYTVLGLTLGAALGAAIASILQGTAGMPQSGTGLTVGFGLIAGYLIGSRLDLDAAKANRVLKTSLR